VIVALDFERDRPAIADIDNTGVFFARFDQNVRPGGGKFLQFFSRIFVRAVLAPHDRENAELGEVRFTPEDFFDALEFFRCKAVLCHNFRCHNRIDSRRLAGHRHVTLANPAACSIAQIGN
jgi:hypothetical protein